MTCVIAWVWATVITVVALWSLEFQTVDLYYKITFLLYCDYGGLVFPLHQGPPNLTYTTGWNPHGWCPIILSIQEVNHERRMLDDILYVADNNDVSG